MPYVHRKSPETATPIEPIGGINPLSATATTTPITSSNQLSSIASSYPERIRKRMEVAAKYDSQYIPTTEEIREIEFERYKQVFQSSLVRDILFLRRIRKPIDGTEWLVCKYQDTIHDDAGDPRSFAYYMGFDIEPMPTVKRNNLREIISVTFDKEKIVYNIPFSKKAVGDILATAVNVPSDMALAYGTEYGPDPWRGNELTIWNLNDFLEYPFDVLERANKGGYSRKDGTGIEDMFKDDKDEEKKLQLDTQRLNIQKTEQAVRKAKYQQQQEQQQQKQ